MNTNDVFNKKYFLIFLTVLLLTVTGTAADKGPGAYYLEGIQLGKQGRFDDAEVRIRRALEKYPYYFAAQRAFLVLEDLKNNKTQPQIARLLFQGMEYAGAYKWKQNVQVTRKAYRLQPDYYFTIHNYASALFDHDRNKYVDQSIELYKIALEKWPKNPYSAYNLGLAYKHKGLANHAIQSFNNTLSWYPSYFPAYYQLACLYLDTGQPVRARIMLVKAIQAAPGSPRIFEMLQDADGSVDHFEAVLESFEQFLSVKPGDPSVTRKLMITASVTGRWRVVRRLRERGELEAAAQKAAQQSARSNGGRHE